MVVAVAVVVLAAVVVVVVADAVVAGAALILASFRWVGEHAVSVYRSSMEPGSLAAVAGR